jgi:hypothetical protein
LESVSRALGWKALHRTARSLCLLYESFISRLISPSHMRLPTLLSNPASAKSVARGGVQGAVDVAINATLLHVWVLRGFFQG